MNSCREGLMLNPQSRLLFSVTSIRPCRIAWKGEKKCFVPNIELGNIQSGVIGVLEFALFQRHESYVMSYTYLCMGSDISSFCEYTIMPVLGYTRRQVDKAAEAVA